MGVVTPALRTVFTEAEAVEAGQHAVDHHDVEFLPGRQKQTVTTIVSDFDNMPLLTQAFGQILRRLPIVLDDEYPHAPPGPNKAGPTVPRYCRRFVVKIANATVGKLSAALPGPQLGKIPRQRRMKPEGVLDDVPCGRCSPQLRSDEKSQQGR